MHTAVMLISITVSQTTSGGSISEKLEVVEEHVYAKCFTFLSIKSVQKQGHIYMLKQFQTNLLLIG